VIGIQYRLTVLRQLFTAQETVALLDKTAFRFFNMLRNDLLDTIVLMINRLLDPANTFNKYPNVSLQQLIDSIDIPVYSELIITLKDIRKEIKSKSARLEYWRDKWVGHRDYGILLGQAPVPAISLTEFDEVLLLIAKFLNKFENIFQDGEINLYGKSDKEVKEIADNEQLRIKHEAYKNMIFQDDGNTIVEIIKQAISSTNN
jgi:hypothetical protein